MSDFQTPLVLYTCKTAACGFETKSKEEAADHQEETGHQWFRVHGRMPGYVGTGWGA